LELELTEGLAMGNVEGLLATLAGLKSLGVSIAIDDFGTGYSSLSYLKRFPIDRLKIDQSFVRNLPGSEDDAAIARTIIALGRSLGLHVIAEGVENYEQLEFLRLHGCDEAQGYYYGRPMHAA
jgi:EAL domain-containing protein (putative c-di-GMP-specific phosphodiesterase class I)